MRTFWLAAPLALALACSGWILWGNVASVSAGEPTGASADGEAVQGLEGREHPLPLPTTKTLVEYEKLLFPFVLSRDYATSLGWAVDKGVRDTGPYIRGTYFGTHPAVRIWYSPKVMYWLTGNPDFWAEGKEAGLAPPKKPREGQIADGGMIVKEMFRPPAARYEDMTEEQIVRSLFDPSSPGFTVMVKDSAGAPDGWFWASVWKDQHYDTPDSLNYPEAGFTMACVRCHSVAQEKGTFAALRNIKGFAGDPISFFVDDTWRDIPRQQQPFTFTHGPALPELQSARAPGPCLPNPEFLNTFDSMAKVCYEAVRKLPSEANDHVVSDPKNISHFLTSDQCMMCHSGANSKYSFGPIMFLETQRGGLNVSPYGEWRWSPMGLAGRDPVFHAQLESELSMLKSMLGEQTGGAYGDQVVNTCLRCHGAMGKRQYDHDQGVGGHYWDPKANFDREWYYLADPSDSHNKYGALARDGISCAICHHMTEEHPEIGDFLANSITGQFKLGPPDEMYGPFEEVITKPMEHSLGVKPKYNPFLKKSRLCASCHIISLPVVDWPLDNPPTDAHDTPPEDEIEQLLASEKNPNFKGFLHRIEQATYLEWLNSKFQDEYGERTEDTKSCQDCHMSTGYESLDGTIKVDPIRTKIATIEDQDYPEVDHRLPMKDITVRFREKDFRRHTFQGLNVFLAEIFNQFNDVLGVRKGDFETGVGGIPFAIENYVQNARKNTAKIEIKNLKAEGQTLEADVKVTNLTGHRLPSGVGFRRVFIEFLVIDETNGQPRVIWSSGQTNGVGVLLDQDGQVLPSEFLTPYFTADGDVAQAYQPHHQLITSPDQVQIYEELAQDASRRFTTSFIRRAHHVKENRLLPAGWTPEGPSPDVPSAFVHATHPGHDTAGDPEYGDGSGTDTVKYRITLPECFDCMKVKVKATLYSQAWAPYFLRDRFTDVPDGPEGDARRRLYYLASHLETDGTPIEGWKLELVSDEASPGDKDEDCSDEGKGCG